MNVGRDRRTGGTGSLTPAYPATASTTIRYRSPFSGLLSGVKLFCTWSDTRSTACTKTSSSVPAVLENYSNPSFDMKRQSTSTVVPLKQTSGVTIWWPVGTIPRALSDGYHAIVVPFPTQEHHMVDELSRMIEYRIGLIFGSSPEAECNALPRYLT